LVDTYVIDFIQIHDTMRNVRTVMKLEKYVIKGRPIGILAAFCISFSASITRKPTDQEFRIHVYGLAVCIFHVTTRLAA
jgi:hypothetical protein